MGYANKGAWEHTSFLTDKKRQELAQDLVENYTGREVLERARAHFETHPTMPGEKVFKDRVNELLDDPETLDAWDPDGSEKADIAQKLARTQIRETKLGLHFPDPELGFGEYGMDKSFKFTHVMDTQTENGGDVKVYSVDAQLRKVKDKRITDENGNAKVQVGIYAKKNPNVERYTRIGTVPDNFLANNPMNVDRCPAQISVEDYSNGQRKNIAERLVVDNSTMSGDTVELSADMLSGLDKSDDLKQ